MAFRKNTPSKGAAQNKMLSRRITKIERAIEQHYFDLPIDTNIGWDGHMFTLNAVPQGDSDVSRTGDALSCVNLDINYSFTRVNMGFTVRIIVLKDFQNTITNPSDFLSSVTTTNSVFDHLLWDNRKRFKVLHDRFIRLDGTFSTTEIGRIHINLKGLRTQFSSGTTTIQTGALKLFAISNVNPGIGTAPALDLWSRLIFEDL